MLAVGSFCLDVHTVDTVEHVKVIDVYRTCVCLHGGEYICQWHTRKFHFITVYIEVELGNICLEGR